jgi:hypothetical protein
MTALVENLTEGRVQGQSRELDFTPWSGAYNRVPADATAFVHREELFSHREDVTLANPFGPPARGWEQVAEAQERGASVFRDGEIYDFETIAKYVTPKLACILWIERTDARVGGGEDVIPCDLRVTMARASPRRPHNHPSASRVGDTGAGLSLAKLAEHNFYELWCIAFSLSCFGLIDTIGTLAMGPAFRRS